MYADYLLESQGKHTLETPHGFLTYGFNCVPGAVFPHVYIEDLYVIPSARKTHVATEMADQVAAIARARGCKLLFGSVNARSSDPNRSLLVLQAYGMRLCSIATDTLWMVKDL